jgi:hypothetical protein
MRIETKILFILSCILLFSPTVSAYYEVYQGDIVYRGETVDISRVMSWKNQFAYWKSGEYEGDYPDKIISVSGYMYSYYIDPEKYEVGTYWKWEGQYMRNGNNLAFYVKEGVRPEVTPIPTLNKTNTTNLTNITPVPTMPPLPTGEHVLIARGDRGVLNYEIDEKRLINGLPQKAYLWLFGSKSKILGNPLTSTKTGSIYSYEFNSTVTQSLTEGKYTGYLQFVGNNNIQDVFYDPIKNTLDSPFKAVISVNIDPFLPDRIKQEFEKLAVPSSYCDDFLVPVVIEIATPAIWISDYWEDGNSMIVEGTTNLEEGTDLVAMIDPDHFALLNEIADRKYSSKATGNYSAMRQFSIRIPFRWDELNLGRHTVNVSAFKYGLNVISTVDFEVSGIWVQPTPPPEFRQFVVDENGSHRVPTQVPTITPIPAQTTTVPTTSQVLMNGTLRNITSRNQTIIRPANYTSPQNVTITPTPPPTRTPEPVPTDDVVIPLNPMLAGIAVIITGLALRKR